MTKPIIAVTIGQKHYQRMMSQFIDQQRDVMLPVSVVDLADPTNDPAHPAPIRES